MDFLSLSALVVAMAWFAIIIMMLSTDTGTIAFGAACLIGSAFGPVFVTAIAFGFATSTAIAAGLIAGGASLLVVTAVNR